MSHFQDYSFTTATRTCDNCGMDLCQDNALLVEGHSRNHIHGETGSIVEETEEYTDLIMDVPNPIIECENCCEPIEVTAVPE